MARRPTCLLPILSFMAHHTLARIIHSCFTLFISQAQSSSALTWRCRFVGKSGQPPGNAFVFARVNKACALREPLRALYEAPTTGAPLHLPWAA